MILLKLDNIKTKILLFLSGLILSSNFSFSQINEFSNWYFGDNAGLTWKVLQPNGDPTPVYDGQTGTIEAVGTVSDSYGSLLFYTDGSTVFNRNHLPMENSLASSPGGKLKGHFSSSTLAIVPNPVYHGIYYIFTTASELGPDGLCYSKLDMSLNNGLGDIVLAEKNVCIYTPSTEKVVVIQHANEASYWVVTHPWNSNQFYTYLVDGGGVHYLNPVISTAGVYHTGSSSNAIGIINSSPLGNKVALSIHHDGKVQILQFNKSTGQLSQPITIENQLIEIPYGVEFSPNESILYVTEGYYTSPGYTDSDLYQFNLCLLTESEINNSIIHIAMSGTVFGDMKIGPDYKIYISNFSSNFVGRISSPNYLGNQCQFTEDCILLNSSTDTTIKCSLGLPSNVPYISSRKPAFEYSPCNFVTEFTANNDSGATEYHWNFNYPSTDAQFQLSDTDNVASFQYPSPGTYYVELKINRFGFVDSCLQQIFIEFPFEPNLGQDTVLCTNASLIQNLSFLNSNSYNQIATFSWHAIIENSDYYSSNSIYSITKPGQYSVTVSGYGICPPGSDEIVVEYNNVVADFGLDSLVTACVQSPVMLNASYLNSSFGPVLYHWNTSQISPSITPLQSGMYSVTVSSGYCQAENSIQVNYDNPIVSPFNTNFYLCEDSFLVVSALNPGASYHWSTAEQTPELLVNSSGTYIVTISNACGNLIDSANVFLITNGQNLLEDITFKCENSSHLLSVVSNVPNEQYLWNNAETMGFIEVMNDGLYQVTVSNQCGSYADSTMVINEHPLSGFLGNDTIVCPGYLLQSLEPGGSYYWLTGETSASIPITSAGTYYLEISNSCGVYWDETTVGLLDSDFAIDLGQDTTICLGDTVILSTGSNYEHVWSDLSTDTVCLAFVAGAYSVTVSNLCYSHSDSLELTIDENTFSFELDTLYLPEGESEIIAVPSGYESYLWSTGQTVFWIEVNTPGVYSLTTEDDFGCFAWDSIIVAPMISIASIETGTINIFPNPSSESEATQITNLPQSSTLHIYSQWGELIAGFRVAQPEYTLFPKSLPAGVYIILIQDAHHTQFLKWVRL